MLIKVCGMRDSTNIRAVDELGIDFMGFIFYPKSPRYVSYRPDYMPKGCKKVGVFVNETTEKIAGIAQEFALDYIQLHGHETVEQCKELKDLGYKIIKVFLIADRSSFDETKAFEPVCDYLLFDTSCASYGGSGKSFNWDLLKFYKGKTPFLLSGGLSLESMALLKQVSHTQLAGVDLNSGFEDMPAMKNTSSIKTFITNINSNE